MDIQYLLALQTFRDGSQDLITEFMKKMTKFGEEYLAFIFVLCIFWCLNKKLGEKALLGIGFSCIINDILKMTFCVLRPWSRSELINPHGDMRFTTIGYSFPSGHTTMAVGAYGYPALHYRKKKTIAIVLFVLAFLVMFSRNFLGVHTPQDVLLGIAATAFCMFICNKIFDWTYEKKNRDIIMLILALVFAILTLVYIIKKPYPLQYDPNGNLIVNPHDIIPYTIGSVGAFFGIVFGLFLEKRFSDFSTDVSLETKINRFLVGTFCYIFLNSVVGRGIGILINDLGFGSIFGKFITFTFCVGIYPIIFSKIEKKRA